MMIEWKNFDSLESYGELAKAERVKLAEVMSGESGAERVKAYSVPMAAGMVYNYAAKQVDENVLAVLKKLAKEAQLSEKYKALYNGEMINTGEKRLGIRLWQTAQTSGLSMWSSRRELLNLQRRYTAARLPMQQVRNLQRLYRSESAEAI